jgi:hypothetical protein
MEAKFLASSDRDEAGVACAQCRNGKKESEHVLANHEIDFFPLNIDG